MRNSFHTAGFSEVMHEAKHDPAEADFVYTAVARNSPHRGLSARLAPALFGTVKSARDLTVELDSADDRAAGPSPMDLALTGIASCAVTTLLGGGTAREIVFDSAEMLIQHGGHADESEAAVRCRLEVEGATDRERLDQLIEHMRSFSPNMATMTGAVSVALDCLVGADESTRRQIAVGEPAAVAARSAACLVRWISGTQLESRPTDAPTLRVDQPKQLTGVDWGPNPQEYLLMGLAADVADLLGQLGYQLTGERHLWEVSATAREDIRGLLLKEYEVVLLQDVACTVTIPEALGAGGEAEKIVGAAFAQSEVRDLIARPHPADVALVFGG